MRKLVLVAAITALLTTTMTGFVFADGGPYFVCYKSQSGAMRLVDDPSECIPSEEEALPFPSGGGGIVVEVREASYAVPSSGTYQYLPYAAACAPGEQAIGGGMYWDDPNTTTGPYPLTGERLPAGTSGRIVGGGWEVLMLDVDAGEASSGAPFTVFVVCAT